ncbi:MAG TPA: putative glycoside hydrolase, partial [Burkholderiales bacterium]|nr:putative glycoside hydrolase [Burkholderiales bacterium]
MAAALPVAAQTAPTKFIPTFLLYHGGGPALVAADAAKLAKFDLIDIERMRYNSIGPNTWAAIKSLNPNAQIYLYEMAAEAPSHLDGAAQVNLNGLGRHNVSRGHPQGSLNGNNPGLFQLDASGKRIYNLFTSNSAANRYWYLMDFGSAAYQAYWLAAVKADIVNQPWVADGVFADNCLTSAGSGRYNQTSAWYSTNATWSAAMNSFAGAITSGLHGVGQKLWCNRGETRTVDGSAAWKSLDNSASPPDVLLEEGAFAVQWGSANTQFFDETEWKRQVDIMGAIKNSKVAMLSHTKLLEGQSGTDNFGKPVTYWQTLWYSLSSFLLGKNDQLNNTHFMFSGSSGYDKIWWHEEYDKIDLGKAIGPYAVSTIGSAKVYWREFEKGYVYVNPSAFDVSSVSLPQTSKRLTHENLQSPPSSIANVTTIALKSHDAAILLKSDATAPSDPTGPTVSPFASAFAASDTTDPSIPTGLRGTAVSSTQINLSWNASTDNVGVRGYQVFRNDTMIGTTTTTSFQSTGLAANTTYSYRVLAFDTVNYSGWTPTAVSVRTLGSPSGPDTTDPSIPTGLTGTAVSSSQINLSWNASTDNVGVRGYQVFRNDTMIGTTANTWFQNTGLAAGTTYNYRVLAFDASNYSGWTPTAVSVKTLGTGSPPPVPGTALFVATFPTNPFRAGSGDGMSNDGVWWVEQKAGTNRATVVSVGRDGGTGLRLHTEPGDNNVSGSGAHERND